MPRPSSVALFERLYLASIAVYFFNAVLFWSGTRALMAATPRIQADAAMAALVTPIMAVSLAVALSLSLLFWMMVVRWRMVTGKWLVVVTEAIGGALGLVSLVRLLGGHSPNPGSVALGLVSTAMAVAAAAMLFRPDAAAWLARGREMAA